MKVQLILFDKSTLEVKEALQDVTNPIIEGQDISWEGGSMKEVSLPFIIIEDLEEVADKLTNEILGQDQSEKYLKVDLSKENQKLKEDIRRLQEDNVNIMLALTSVYESLNGGGNV
jgi:hypothetical protein